MTAPKEIKVYRGSVIHLDHCLPEEFIFKPDHDALVFDLEETLKATQVALDEYGEKLRDEFKYRQECLRSANIEINKQSLTIRQLEAAIKELKGECYAWAKDKFTTEDSFEKYKHDLNECIEAAKKAVT